MTIVERFSKMVHFVALPKLPSAAETVDLLTSHVVRLHGIPQNIVSYRGPQFTSAVWRAFCRGIGATISLSSGYHPQTNRQAERANQALEATLRCMTTSNPASWSLHLPWVEYSLNTIVSSATGLSTFMCSLGYQPPLFPSQETEAAVPSVQAHLCRCRRIWKAVRDSMITYRDRVERSANRRRVPALAYHPGQRVWLLARDLPLPTVSKKLAPRYVGPYTIAQVINPSALRLTLPSSLKIHPVFHVSQVKPVATCPLSPPAPVPPPPRILEGGDLVWEANRILEVRRHGFSAFSSQHLRPPASPETSAILPSSRFRACGSFLPCLPRQSATTRHPSSTLRNPAPACTPLRSPCRRPPTSPPRIRSFCFCFCFSPSPSSNIKCLRAITSLRVSYCLFGSALWSTPRVHGITLRAT